MDATLAAIAATQHGLLTTTQALANGYSHDEIRRKVQRGEWRRLRRGVYVEAAVVDPLTSEARHRLAFHAYALKARVPIAASDITAAVFHDFALLDADLTTIHVTRPGTHPASGLDAGVRTHAAELAPSDVLTIDGALVTTPSRTVIDVARHSTFRQGVVTADSALWRHATTHADLLAALVPCLDWPGARMAGRVVSFAQIGAESVGESLSRIVFAECGLPAPALQVPMYDGAGLIGRVDFYWEAHATVGEFDGRAKYAGLDSAGTDALIAEKRREDRLRALGLQVVRFGWVDLHGGQRQLNAALRAAFARGELARRATG